MAKDTHIEIRKEASKAAEAALIAQKVAQEASEVAKHVVEKAEQTAEKVLLFSQTMEYIQRDIAEIKTKLDNKYVSKEEFKPVKMIAYGMIGIIMTALITGIMYALVHH